MLWNDTYIVDIIYTANMMGYQPSHALPDRKLQWISLDYKWIPDYMKYATVRPLLKKPNLDPSVYSNFRPISNFPFIAKILEKVVFNQLQDFLSANSILDTFQSGFRVRHSTETALLKVCNDSSLQTLEILLF